MTRRGTGRVDAVRTCAPFVEVPDKEVKRSDFRRQAAALVVRPTCFAAPDAAMLTATRGAALVLLEIATSTVRTGWRKLLADFPSTLHDGVESMKTSGDLAPPTARKMSLVLVLAVVALPLR